VTRRLCFHVPNRIDWSRHTPRNEERMIIRSVLLFGLAGLAEIGGG